MKYKIYRAILYKPTSETGHTGNRLVKESRGNLATAEYELIPEDFIPSDNIPSGEVHYSIEEYEVSEEKISEHYYVRKKSE